VPKIIWSSYLESGNEALDSHGSCVHGRFSSNSLWHVNMRAHHIRGYGDVANDKNKIKD